MKPKQFTEPLRTLYLVSSLYINPENTVAAVRSVECLIGIDRERERAAKPPLATLSTNYLLMI